jgi:UDP-N-acetylglucosamine:LPS N-acetylglucosamine transferase
MASNNFLILTADAGFGHRGTANALAKALKLRYGSRAQVMVANPLDDPKAPAILRSAEGDYDIVARRWSEFHKLGYRMSDLALATSTNEMAFAILTYDIICGLIRRHQPDVVVITYPTYQYPLEIYRRLNSDAKPVALVVTNLVTLGRLRIDKDVDLYIVPNKTTAAMALDRGIAAERVNESGLPVDPSLAQEPVIKQEARAKLGWDPDLFTVLAVGSKRVEGLERFVDILNHAGFPYQIVAVAGGNDELYEEWLETEWHVPAHVFNYVSDMPAFLRAADCVLSKAGGLIVSEALASGLPLFIMQVIPGQETGNAQFVVSGGAGDMTLEPLELLRGMAHWLADGQGLYQERATNARRLGRPNAAYDAADLIWQLAQTGPAIRRKTPVKSTENLKKLLRQFGVTAKDSG